MSDNPNARELLREARGYVNSMEVEYQHRNEGGYYEEELRRAVDLKDRIDAYLAAPSESAMEMVRQIRDLESYGGGDYEYYLDATEAAARIEGLQRRVPRKFVEELWDWQWEDDDEMTAKINKIAAKHDVKVEG